MTIAFLLWQDAGLELITSFLLLYSLIYLALKIYILQFEIHRNMAKEIREIHNVISQEVLKSTQRFHEQKEWFHQKQQQESLNLYRQIEALISLNEQLDLRPSVTGLRGWALSPDAATRIVSLILDKKPKKVLEFGGGVSTALIGRALQKNESGRLVSIDHNENFANKTSRLLHKYHVDKRVNLVTKKLKETKIKNKKWLWYDLADSDIPDGIELVLVDGPPSKTQKLARYPALPLLDKKLKQGAVVLLDDYGRADERETVERWLKEFPNYSLEEVETEKRMAILTKQAG